MHRIRAFFPTITTLLILLLLIIHIMIQLFNHPLEQFGFSAYTTFSSKHRSLFRLFIGPFVHANWLHLLKNIFSLALIGGAVEHRFGSIIFLYFSIIVLSPLSSLLTVTIYGLMHFLNAGNWMAIFRLHNLYMVSVVGYSGVLFGYLGLWAWTGPKSFSLPRTQVSFPTWILPFFFLLLTLIISPHSSTVCHASGMAIAFLIKEGLFTFCKSLLKLCRAIDNCGCVRNTQFLNKINYLDINEAELDKLNCFLIRKMWMSTRIAGGAYEHQIFKDEKQGKNKKGKGGANPAPPDISV